VRLQAPPHLTRSSIRTAYALAVTVDIAQFLLGPFGWAGADEVLDAAAMIAMTRLLGFHPLFLPTFILEFVPFTDMLRDARRALSPSTGFRLGRFGTRNRRQGESHRIAGSAAATWRSDPPSKSRSGFPLDR